MSAVRAVVWHVDVTTPEAGRFRWGRAGDGFVAEWPGILTLHASALGELEMLRPDAGAPQHLVEKTRNGPAAAFLRGLGGRPSLHASAVAVAGAATLFVGPSGAGKSTLASRLCATPGFELLADDIVGLEAEGTVWRAMPSESVVWLGAEGGGSKDRVPCPQPASRAARVLTVAALRYGNQSDGVAVRRLRGAEAAGALVGAMVRFDAQPEVWKRELDVVDALLKQVRVVELSRPRTVDAGANAEAVRRILIGGGTLSAAPDIRVVVPEQVHFRRFDDEMLVLDLNRGEYYALNAVGARMWAALAEGRSPDEVAAALAGEYEIGSAVLLQDCMTLVDELCARGLLRPRVP